MKIAICLPSYNEANNIQNSTIIIDRGLSKYFKNYECFIVNADNSSPDGTNEIFNKVTTQNAKHSLIETKAGKGYNLINFFKFCKENEIDYAATIDSDVVSINEEWVLKLLTPLIKNNADYVTPIYKRHRYEGSTTNHFVFPAVFALTNQFIRQPIAGDFAFSKKFINMILEQKINDEIQQYGIDIFMTLNTAFNGLKIEQVVLGNKFHNPSFNKMEGMFRQVLRGFIFTVQNNLDKLQKKLFRESKIPIFEECISKVKIFKHKDFAIKKFNESQNNLMQKGIKINKRNIEELWIKEFKMLIENIKNNTLTEEFLKNFEEIFFARATSFWIHSQHISAKNAENEIIEQSKKIYKEINL